MKIMKIGNFTNMTRTRRTNRCRVINRGRKTDVETVPLDGPLFNLNRHRLWTDRRTHLGELLIYIYTRFIRPPWHMMYTNGRALFSPPSVFGLPREHHVARAQYVPIELMDAAVSRRQSIRGRGLSDSINYAGQGRARARNTYCGKKKRKLYENHRVRWAPVRVVLRPR